MEKKGEQLVRPPSSSSPPSSTTLPPPLPPPPSFFKQTTKSTIAGGFGGACLVLVGHPLDTIKGIFFFIFLKMIYIQKKKRLN